MSLREALPIDADAGIRVLVTGAGGPAAIAVLKSLRGDASAELDHGAER
jgi:hypothetical protein